MGDSLAKKPSTETKKLVLFTFVFVFAIVILYYISSSAASYLSVESIRKILHDYGLIGVFFAALLGNLTLFFPLPIDATVYILGLFDFGFGVLNPAVLGLVAGIGAGIGEMSGYAAGLIGRQGVKRFAGREMAQMKSVQEGLKKYGFAFILIAAFTPLPFDLVGIVAGLMRYDLRKFFIGAILGKIARCIVIAYAGYFSLSFVASFFGVSI